MRSGLLSDGMFVVGACVSAHISICKDSLFLPERKRQTVKKVEDMWSRGSPILSVPNQKSAHVNAQCSTFTACILNTRRHEQNKAPEAKHHEHWRMVLVAEIFNFSFKSSLTCFGWNRGNWFSPSQRTDLLTPWRKRSRSCNKNAHTRKKTAF